jgi:hypothetical protein
MYGRGRVVSSRTTGPRGASITEATSTATMIDTPRKPPAYNPCSPR